LEEDELGAAIESVTPTRVYDWIWDRGELAIRNQVLAVFDVKHQSESCEAFDINVIWIRMNKHCEFLLPRRARGSPVVLVSRTRLVS
jgi:hypothetical protein